MVKFHNCGQNIQLSTSDKRFVIHHDGSVRATRLQTISSVYRFQVIAKDLKTRETFEAHVNLHPSENHLIHRKHKIMKRSPEIIYFPKKSISRWQKREWIIPPLDIMENELPNKNPIAIIRSDYEDNGIKVTYKISGKGVTEQPIGLFVIDPITGELNVTQSIDRETYPNFTLIGEAFELHSNRQLEQKLDLIIRILDANDNSPEFSLEVMECSIAELSSVGTIVLQLNATDKDIGKNAKIAYKLLSATNSFWIQQSGAVKVNIANLDRETKNMYSIIVEARDDAGSSNGLTSTATVHIKITDVNDNVPKCEKNEFEQDVMENLRIGEALRIKVFDLDQEFTDNWLAKFIIIKGNENGYFRIDVDNKTNEGILVVQKELDYEEMQEIQLVVKLVNQAAYHSSVSTVDQASTITVKLHVKDQKEGFKFKPIRWIVNRTETTKTTTFTNEVLGKYVAVSADSGKESSQTTYAKHVDQANWVTVNSVTGEITLIKPLDRESKYVVDGKYIVTILAINHESSISTTSTGTIILNVEDSNDNVPIIQDLEPCICDKTKMIKITAVDIDQVPNSVPFTFQLGKDQINKWKIGRADATSMQLIPLFDLWPGSFDVPIKVQDRQGAGSMQNVRIRVVECDDAPTYGVCAAKSVQRFTALGGSAIGLMLLGFLLLLLIPMLLLFCKFGSDHSGKFEQIPSEPVWNLPIQDVEGPEPVDPGECGIGLINGSCAVNGSSAYIGSGAYIGSDAYIGSGLYGGGGGVGGLGGVGGGVGGRGGGGGGFTITETSIIGDNHNHNHSVIFIPGGHKDSSSQCIGQTIQSQVGYQSTKIGRSDRYCESSIEKYFNEKLYGSAAKTEAFARDTLLVYNYEGLGSLAGSIDDLHEGEVQDLSFLDDLGPSFKTLASICTGTFESEISTVNTNTVSETSVIQEGWSSSTAGKMHTNADMLQPMHIKVITPPKQVVVTTRIESPMEIMPQVIQGPDVTNLFINKNVVSKSVHASGQEFHGMTGLPGAGIGYQELVSQSTSTFHPGGMQEAAIVVEPQTFVQKNVILNRSTNSPRREMQSVQFGTESENQSNVMFTNRSVQSGEVSHSTVTKVVKTASLLQ
uniref:Desmoglein-2-like protein n=1 Tax=Callorhinchus milii TaxID=7868 RepID=V9K9F2_CALMI